MKWHKHLLQQEWFQAVICWIIASYIRFVFSTTHWTYKNNEVLEDVYKQDRPVIFAFWHGRLMLMSLFHKKPENVYVIISKHGDGRLISRVVKHFSVNIIQGSSNRVSTDKKGAKNRGGSRALRQTIKVLRDGGNIAITPDGPKGPRMRVQSAIANISSISGVPVLPVAYSTTRGKFIKSWDRFLLSYPFGRGWFICGDLIHIPKDADEKTLQKAGKDIENTLSQLSQEADILAGRDPVTPSDEKI